MDVLNTAMRLPFMQLEFAEDGQVFVTFLTEISGAYVTKNRSLHDGIGFLSPSPRSALYKKKPVIVLCFRNKR
jgi:hypothetical protein